MQEEKSKLKAFTSAVTAAAQERAAKINAETEQHGVQQGELGSTV